MYIIIKLNQPLQPQQALFHTGNYNADLAAAWIFENQDREDLDAPLAASEV